MIGLSYFGIGTGKHQAPPPNTTTQGRKAHRRSKSCWPPSSTGPQLHLHGGGRGQQQQQQHGSSRVLFGFGGAPTGAARAAPACGEVCSCCMGASDYIPICCTAYTAPGVRSAAAPATTPAASTRRHSLQTPVACTTRGCCAPLRPQRSFSTSARQAPPPPLRGNQQAASTHGAT